MPSVRTLPRLVLVALTVALVTVPATAVATHVFSDVADDATHAEGIEYVADAGITAGCETDEYCPSDEVTRAQMGTFLYRASGHDPDTPASVNAAELGGQQPSAYTTDVFKETLGTEVDLDGHDDAASAVTVLEASDLPAGEYAVEAQLLASAFGQIATDPETDASRVVCQAELDGALVSESLTRIGNDAGHMAQHSLQVTGTGAVGSGGGDLTLQCYANDVSGDAPVIFQNAIVGDSATNQLIARRIGDAS